MTLIILLSIASALVALAFARTVFHDYPAAAVDQARNELFKHRADLFEVARSGGVAFDHQGYALTRRMINGMIGYAHHMSFWQLLLSRVLFRIYGHQYAESLRARQMQALASLPEDVREKVKAIEMRAFETLFGLMIKRSVLFSTLLSVVVFVVIIFKVAITAMRGLHPARAPGRGGAGVRSR